jgi:hypothetical protein
MLRYVDLVVSIEVVVRKVAVHLGYGTYIWLSVPQLPLQCAVVSLYSVVNPLTPNDHYNGRTAPLTFRRCILNIYSTNISIE